MKEICVVCPGVKVGSRVECDGEIGSVRYVGDVESTTALWLGVEWDNPERGKHDGFYNGQQYFSTRHPSAGSFVRPQKVYTGRSCIEAIRERYGETKVSLLAEEDRKLQFSQNKVIEFVGADKMAKIISRLSYLHEANLLGMGVRYLGPENGLRTLSPNIVELDLSKNLLSCWEHVADITNELPLLQNLILSENRLQAPLDTKVHEKSFTSLKTLVLNKMDYTWEEVCDLGEMWPKLENLILCSNNVSQIQPPLNNVFRNVTCLDLSHNSLCGWRDVCNLGHLPRLQKLILSDNCLSGISFTETPESDKTSLFSNLKNLNLSRNSISKWEEVSELNKLQNLQKLELSGNPVMITESFETSRQLAISRLESVSTLDGIEVARQERRGAEVDYLKKFYDDWRNSKGNEDLQKEFNSSHPRYENLVHVHGAPEISEAQKQKPVLKNALLSLNIYSPMVPDMPPIRRKLPTTMTVGKLKALIHRIYHVGMEDLKLSYKTIKKEEFYPVDNDLRQLAYFEMIDGDNICVEW